MQAEMRILAGPKHWMAAKLGQGNGMPKPTGAGRAAPRRGTAPFDYPAQQVGQAGAGTVWVADSLGSDGQTAARQILNHAGDDVLKIMRGFGMSRFPACDLIIAPLSQEKDGGGGAYHYGCDGTTLYADFAGPDRWERTLALFVAELAEVAMAVAGKGWDCGASAGEGLSRLWAESLHPGQLDDYATVGQWLDGDRAPWVRESDPTDTNPLSTGCAVCYLGWLIACQHTDINAISQAGGSNLAETFVRLGLMGDAQGQFMQAVERAFPAGQPSAAASDDVWQGKCEGGTGQPAEPDKGGLWGPRIFTLPAGTYMLTELTSNPAADKDACHQAVDELLAAGCPCGTLQSMLGLMLGLVKGQGLPSGKKLLR